MARGLLRRERTAQHRFDARLQLSTHANSVDRQQGHIGQNAASIDARQLVAVSKQHQTRVGGRRLNQLAHHRHVDHRGFIDHNQLKCQRVCGIVPKPRRRTGLIAQHPVQRAGLQLAQPLPLFIRNAVTLASRRAGQQRLAHARGRLAGGGCKRHAQVGLTQRGTEREDHFAHGGGLSRPWAARDDRQGAHSSHRRSPLLLGLAHKTTAQPHQRLTQRLVLRRGQRQQARAAAERARQPRLIIGHAVGLQQVTGTHQRTQLVRSSSHKATCAHFARPFAAQRSQCSQRVRGCLRVDLGRGSDLGLQRARKRRQRNAGMTTGLRTDRTGRSQQDGRVGLIGQPSKSVGHVHVGKRQQTQLHQRHSQPGKLGVLQIERSHAASAGAIASPDSAPDTRSISALGGRSK